VRLNSIRAMLTLALASVAFVLLGAACASSNAASGSNHSDRAPSGSLDTRSKNLLLVVNPSARARRLAFAHAREIVQSAAAPNLTLLGIYEQPTGIRKAPFDRPFISTRTVSLRPVSSAGCKGTEFQRKKCERDQEKLLKDEEQANAAAVELWKQKAVRTLDGLGRRGPTEEAPGNAWDLRGAFLQAGQSLKALDPGTRCVVLLGGVAVRNPPSHLRADLLAGTTVLIPGWNGTQKVQDRWSKKLSGAGARVSFLPQAVTDLELVDRVGSCLQGKAASS
jgi:hypothetical protein